MPWLKRCPRAWIVAYLQGVAESDGHVHKQGRYADVAGRPNLRFYRYLFKILKIKANLYPKRAPRTVRISIASAAQLPLFNPIIRSYRYEGLIKHASKRGIPPPSSFSPSVFNTASGL
jgi:hypothetical protein